MQHFEENEYEWKNLLNRIYGYRGDHDGFQPVSLIGEYAFLIVLIQIGFDRLRRRK